MPQWLSTLKVAQLSPDAAELALSLVRVTLSPPMNASNVTAANVRQAMEDADMLPPGVKVALFFKDEENDFVALPNMDEKWPSCCISDTVIKAWYMCVPEPVATPESRCLGPHVHQPPKKKRATLNHDEFQGYSLLAAAGDGCADCVQYWLGQGVNPNFESSSCAHTALDWVLWAKKKSQISAASAKQLSEMLENAGGQANSMSSD